MTRFCKKIGIIIHEKEEVDILSNNCFLYEIKYLEKKNIEY